VTLWPRVRAPLRDGFRARRSLARRGRSLDFLPLAATPNAPFAAEFRLIGLVVGPLWNSASLTQVS
jgi:hypothetical protein